jgi:hypothetical protein
MTTRQRPRLWVKIRGAMAGDGDFQRLGPYVLLARAQLAGAGAPAHLPMGELLMSERRFDPAEQEFAEAARLDPGEGRATRLLTLVRETRSGRP